MQRSRALPELPEWLLLEGGWYRRSDSAPSGPPWTHVNRAAARPPSTDCRGAISPEEVERLRGRVVTDGLNDKTRRVEVRVPAGHELVLRPAAGGQ